MASTTGGRGGYAERVAVPTELLIPVPDSLGLRHAAALLADGRTALGLIRISRLRAGEVVFIAAAAGGVGTYVLQLTRSASATVIAGVGSEEKLQVVNKFGADLAVDYSCRAWADAVRDQYDGLDVVFDGVGETAVEVLRRGGRLCRYGLASGRFTRVPSRRRDVEVIEGTSLPAADWQALSVTALERAAARSLRTAIGQVLQLDRSADCARRDRGAHHNRQDPVVGLGHPENARRRRLTPRLRLARCPGHAWPGGEFLRRRALRHTRTPLESAMSSDGAGSLT